MEDFLTKLDMIVPLPQPCKEFLRKHLYYEEYEEKEILLKPGEISNTMAFIDYGFLQGYGPTHWGMTVFRYAGKGDLYISPMSYFQQLPAVEYTQALDDTALYELSFNDMDFALKEYEEFRNLFTAMLFKSSFRESTLKIMGTYDQEEKYQWLIDNYYHVAAEHRMHIAKSIGLDAKGMAALKRYNRKHE